MKRIELVVFVTMCMTGLYANLAAACDKCAAKACMVVDKQDLCLLDELIKRQDVTTDDGTAIVEGLIALQLRLRSDIPHVIAADVSFLEKEIVRQKARLKGKVEAERETEVEILEELISLHLRAKICTARARSGIPPKAPRCCNGKNVSIPTPGTYGMSVCDDEQSAKANYTLIVADERPVTHRTAGFSVATCNGPINVGQVQIEGGGRESNRLAGTLLETALRAEQSEYTSALAVRNDCRSATPRTCYGTTRTCSYCRGSSGGCRYCVGSSSSAVQPMCGCAEHRRNILQRGGNLATEPCTCRQPCRECGNRMVYLGT